MSANDVEVSDLVRGRLKVPDCPIGYYIPEVNDNVYHFLIGQGQIEEVVEEEDACGIYYRIKIKGLLVNLSGWVISRGLKAGEPGNPYWEVMP